MIYRVILKIGYYENWFDFDDVNDAAKFAETVLEHQRANEDRKILRAEIVLKIIDPTKENNNEEEE